MNLANLTQILAYIILPIVTMLVIPIGKWILMKFKELDIQVKTKMSREETKELLDDKIMPLRESLVDLKEKIDKIFDKLLNEK